MTKSATKALQDKLNAVASTTAFCFSGEYESDLKYILEKYPNMDDIKKNEQDSVYYRVHKFLQLVYHQNKLESPIYIL